MLESCSLVHLSLSATQFPYHFHFTRGPLSARDWNAGESFSVQVARHVWQLWAGFCLLCLAVPGEAVARAVRFLGTQVSSCKHVDMDMYVCMCMIVFCSKADSSSRPAVINYGMSLSLSVRCSSTSQSRPMLNFECGMVLVLGINDSGDNRTRAQRGPCVGIWRRRTQLVTTHAFL